MVRVPRERERFRTLCGTDLHSRGKRMCEWWRTPQHSLFEFIYNFARRILTAVSKKFLTKKISTSGIHLDRGRASKSILPLVSSAAHRPKLTCVPTYLSDGTQCQTYDARAPREKDWCNRPPDPLDHVREEQLLSEGHEWRSRKLSPDSKAAWRVRCNRGSSNISRDIMQVRQVSKIHRCENSHDCFPHWCIPTNMSTSFHYAHVLGCCKKGFERDEHYPEHECFLCVFHNSTHVSTPLKKHRTNTE